MKVSSHANSSLHCVEEGCKFKLYVFLYVIVCCCFFVQLSNDDFEILLQYLKSGKISEKTIETAKKIIKDSENTGKYCRICFECINPCKSA